MQQALVIGVGPIGRQITSRLELMGVYVHLVDLSPINLYPYDQQGFSTVAGDARDPDVLRRASADGCHLVVVSVPDDETANQIVRVLRELNRDAAILVRCRYQNNMERALAAGAAAVVSEEAEASGALLRQCEEIVDSARRTQPGETKEDAS